MKRRLTGLGIGLGAALLLPAGALSVWIYLCFQKGIRYPATFREVIEQEFQEQLAMLAEAARSERGPEPDERSAFDEAEILEAKTWRYADPTLRAGNLFKDSEKAKKRYSWLALFRSHPGRGRPGLNLWMTPEGDLIEYEQNVEVKGGHTLGYTVYFDADLLEQRKAEYEAR